MDEKSVSYAAPIHSTNYAPTGSSLLRGAKALFAREIKAVYVDLCRQGSEVIS